MTCYCLVPPDFSWFYCVAAAAVIIFIIIVGLLFHSIQFTLNQFRWSTSVWLIEFLSFAIWLIHSSFYHEKLFSICNMQYLQKTFNQIHTELFLIHSFIRWFTRQVSTAIWHIGFFSSKCNQANEERMKRRSETHMLIDLIFIKSRK